MRKAGNPYLIKTAELEQELRKTTELMQEYKYKA